jgi:DcuC family C4-dicarboxylate transporter
MSTLPTGLVLIGIAIWLIARQVDVRLVLILTAVALGALAGQLHLVVQTFFQTFAAERFVLPICCAMGFAWVLRHTGCDRHLVHLLARPVQRVRMLLIPGTVVIGFLVNVVIISQASTVMTVGPVLLPLLQSAGISPVTSGAALLIGASVGGEMLNQGAPEVQTVSAFAPTEPGDSVRHNWPLALVQLTITTLLFWWVSVPTEKRDEPPAEPPSGEREPPEPVSAQGGAARDAIRSSERPTAAIERSTPLMGLAPPDRVAGIADASPDFRVSLLRAAVPLVPVVLLFLAGPPLRLIDVQRDWLVGPKEPAEMRHDSRLVGVAMLIGVLVAGLVSRRDLSGLTRAFFGGAGYAYAHIVSVIVAAQCFGKAVESIGLAAVLSQTIVLQPVLLVPAAAILSLLFAVICGSGYAATQSMYPFFAGPARELGVDPVGIGTVVSLSTAAGRTMSPVAAVVLTCSEMTGTKPLDLTRRVFLPLLVALAAVVVLRLVFPAL